MAARVEGLVMLSFFVGFAGGVAAMYLYIHFAYTVIRPLKKCKQCGHFFEKNIYSDSFCSALCAGLHDQN